MIITFLNLGPIEEVTIDTEKKMNIITGENGIGKTYLSILLYAILSRYNDRNYIVSPNSLKYDLLNIKKISSAVDKNLKDGLKNDRKDNKKIEFEINLDEYINNKVKKYTIDKFSNMEDFLRDVFVTGNIKKIFQDTSINIEINELSNLSKNINNSEFSFGDEIKMDKNSNRIKFSINPIDRVPSSVLPRILYDFLSQYFFSDSFFFSAERGAINIFNTELSISRNKEMDGLLAVTNNKKSSLFSSRLKRNKRYILPIRDELSFADDVYHISQTLGEFSWLADEIERDMLKGTFKVNKDGQVSFASEKAKTKRVPLDISASSVKTMAGLTLFLRHRATKGMTIFIDEPELNLHPNMQVKMAQIIVKMINSGIRVFISTHSDYIIREINNMVMAMEVGDENLYPKDLHISKSDISVTRLYYEKENSKKLTTEYVEVERDGFEVKSINETVREQIRLNDALWKKLEKL